MARYWIIVLCIAASQLGGCSTTPSLDGDTWAVQAAKREFVAEREQLARRYESRGWYRLALREWRVISAVTPAASGSGDEIERLEKRIRAAVRKHRRGARSATAKSDLRTAQLHLLKLLALQPDDLDAIGKLKKLEMRRAYAGLAQAPKVSAKATQAYEAPAVEQEEGKEEIQTPALEGKAGPTPPVGSSDGKGNFQIALQHFANREYEAALERFLLAGQLKEAPSPVLERHIAETRSALAEQHYSGGVNAFRAARYDQAVGEFKKALVYDPEHKKAQLYLRSASELQMRMQP